MLVQHKPLKTTLAKHLQKPIVLKYSNHDDSRSLVMLVQHKHLKTTLAMLCMCTTGTFRPQRPIL